MGDQGSSGVKFVLCCVLLFKLCFTALGQLVPLSSQIERVGLLDLRSSLGLRARDWPRKADPCLFWAGVQCGQDGRVIGINVSGLRRTRVGRLNPQFAVDSLFNFTRLTTFNASGFLLPGEIPVWFGQSLVSLQVLDLRSCSIFGTIPLSFGNLTNLNLLALSSNRLTGTIPSSLGQLGSLSSLDLSQNSFTGTIPMSFSSLTNLTLLDLSSNFLSGAIPSAFGNLTNLQTLNLSSNSLSANVPAELGGLSRLVDLDLGLNSFSGSLPIAWSGLRNLQRMVMGNNSLSGILSESVFSNLTRLRYVVLSHNTFSGALPGLLLSMPELSFLDVSYNNFNDTLPNISSPVNVTGTIFNLSHNKFFGNISLQLRTFSFIDLSDNYFEGKVVDSFSRNASLSSNCLQNVTNQRNLSDCTLFYADRGLIFDNFGNPNTTSPPPSRGSSKKSKRRLIFILVGVGVGLAFIVLLVLCLVLCLRKRETGDASDQRGRSVGPVPEVGSTPPPIVSANYSNLGEKYTYEQLMQAAAEFDDLNLIKHGHSGDLFKGVLENGSPIVIKRIDVSSFKKESYTVELDFFSKTVHSRFVPFLGHCLGHENEKLLVYKFMPNGDLSNSLYKKSEHEDDSLQSLDWITRLKIAIGAAEGLSYLHHECNPPLVHRDVQASSILLDDKFEVRLGSLSELCKQGDSHQNVITRLLRLPQSSDQGSSASSTATCAYDVYCFGKVLLELVTGKLGISASDDASTIEWLEQTLPNISIYERELVTKIVDPSLIVDEDLLEEVWAMAVVAKSCLNPKPSKRPLMRYILKALENPLKVVREENSGSARLRTASSRGSWNAALFGSWRHSSSDIVGIPGPSMKEGSSSMKQSGTAGSQGSGQCGAGEHSSSNKRLSRDVFPEPVSDMVDTDRHEQD